MRRDMLRAAVSCAALLGTAALALADVEVAVRVGHGGRWVQGAVTPVVLDLESRDPEPLALRIDLDESGLVSVGGFRHERIVHLAPGQRRRETFLVRGPSPRISNLNLRLETDPPVPIHARGKSASKGQMSLELLSAAADPAFDFAVRVVGVVGDAGNVVGSLLPLATPTELGFRLSAASAAGAVAVHPDDLRFAPHVLEGLDALLVCDPEAGFASEPAVAEALLDWVAGGGRLVISLGAHAPQFAASPFAAEIPLRWGAPSQGDYAAVIEHVTGKRLLPEERRTLRGPLAGLETDPGEALLAIDGRALAAAAFFGSGEIVVLGFDVRDVLRITPEEPERFEPFAALLTGRSAGRTQITDVHFPADVDSTLGRVLQGGAFEPPPLALVVLGLGLYVIVVGPLDWFVLRRLRKERLTTFTFAAAVAVFTLLAYGASLFVFAAGELVNRVVFVDLARDPRDGRETIRVQDIAGYYSPRGATLDLEYALPAVIAGSELPGSSSGADVGRTLPVTVRGADPRRPEGAVEVAFRSQRVVRSVIAGPTGRTVEVEWVGEGPRRPRVTNGLPMDLEDVWVAVSETRGHRVGRVIAGGSAEGPPEAERLPGGQNTWGIFGDVERGAKRPEVQAILTVLSVSSARARSDDNLQNQLSPNLLARLRKAGVDRSAALDRGRALLLAFASRAPVPLPGDGTDGRAYVVVRKEVEAP